MMKICGIWILCLLLGGITDSLGQYQLSKEIWSKPEIIWSIKNSGGGEKPSLNRDGTEIYYQRGGMYGQVRRVVKCDTGWGASEAISSKINSLTEKLRPIISPDGKTFYCSSGDIIMRSQWDSAAGDWGMPTVLADSGISGPSQYAWFVMNFLNDTAMVISRYFESYLTKYYPKEKVWGKPTGFPVSYGPMYWDEGVFFTADTHKCYFAYTFNPGILYDLDVSYHYGEGYGLTYRLNLSEMSDSLYQKGEYQGKSESYPFLTADGKTMYFTADYHGARTIYVRRMLVDENGNTVEVRETPGARAETFSVSPAYPTPFNGSATVEYMLRESGRVKIRLYDMTGSELRVLADGEQAAGAHRLRFEAAGLASGAYIVQISFGGTMKTVKLLLMK